MNWNEVFIWGIFGGIPIVIAATLLYSLVRPDPKPPIGKFESYAARIENMEERHWGKLRLKDGVLTFIPYGAADGVSVPLSEITSAEIPWGSFDVTVCFGTQQWRFVTASRALSRTTHVGGVDGGRARKEWRRQLMAAGIRIEPEATEREQWKR